MYTGLRHLFVLACSLFACVTIADAQTVRGTRLYLVDTTGFGRDTTTVLAGANASSILMLPESGATGALLLGQQSGDTTKMAWLLPGTPNSTLTIDAGGNPTWVVNSGSGWSLTGNVGTTAANVLGTLDNQELRIVSNGLSILRLDGATLSIARNASTDPRGYGSTDLQAEDPILPEEINAGDYSIIGSGRRNAILGGEENAILTGSQNLIGPELLMGFDPVNNAVIAGRFNRVQAFHSSVIVGGQSNGVTASASIIGAGENNALVNNISGMGANHGRSIIGAGTENYVAGSESGVLTGTQNYVQDNNWIDGGQRVITSYAAIVSGARNIVAGRSNAILTGENNTVNESYSSMIGAGDGNAIISSQRSFIGSGVTNSIQSSIRSAIVGGNADIIVNATNAFVGGGQQNTIDYGNRGVIVGGANNELFSDYGFIGGGEQNSVRSIGGLVVGGQQNRVSFNSQYSVIVGGVDNVIERPNCVIVGGENNSIAGQLSSIVGGINNAIGENHAFIGGGEFNEVVGEFALVVGGRLNFADFPYDAVVGGLNNRANGSYSFVGGGHFNQVDPDVLVPSRYSSILGGAFNEIRGRYSAVLGGNGLRLGEGQVGYRRPISALATTQEASDSWVGRDDGAIFVNTHLTLANDGGTAQSQLRLYEQRANGLDYVGIRAPASVPSTVVFTMPANAGTAGQVLTTDGAGNLSWATASGSAPTAVSFAVIGNDYVVDGDDQVIVYAANAANANITLPAAATAVGRQIHVINMAGGGNITFVDVANAAVPVRMYRFGGGWITSSTLSGTVNLAANQGLGGSIGNSVTLLCDGFFWYAIAR